MDIYYAVIIFIFGAVIGSFLNVCIYRIPRGESTAYPPSHCTNCGNKIKWYDLIPIISYFVLKGKCRYCGEKISIRYPLIEFITALLYLMLYIKIGIGIDFIKYITFMSILIVVGMIDFDTTDVYFKTTAAGVVFALIFMAVYWNMGFEIRNFIFGGILSGIFFTIIIFITKGGMGWGDMEICVFCGLFLGFKLTLVMMFLSFVLGAAVGMILILSGKKSRKDYIPFGPFISLASIITVFLGGTILNLYL
ncbi:A24 family peptidase [Clostridium sp. Mt-5]|uniref:A24 family peptidase n=1 Tax=Clostridium moutaii TaxID=3240932 RepID=A0ABV4BSU5_9CLOT